MSWDFRGLDKDLWNAWVITTQKIWYLHTLTINYILCLQGKLIQVQLPKYMNELYMHPQIHVAIFIKLIAVSNTFSQAKAYKLNAPSLQQMYWIWGPLNDFVKMSAGWSFELIDSRWWFSLDRTFSRTKWRAA